MLNTIGYEGPISVEWEDAGMDRLVGAPEALEFVKKYAPDLECSEIQRMDGDGSRPAARRKALRSTRSISATV